jgi:hypothetical protein
MYENSVVFECRIFCLFCLLALTVAGQNGPTKKFTGRIKPNFTKSERKGA